MDAIEETVEWKIVCKVSREVLGNPSDLKKEFVYVPNTSQTSRVVPPSKRKVAPLTPDHVIPLEDDTINGFREDSLYNNNYAIALLGETHLHIFTPESGGKWRHQKTQLSPM